MKDDRASKTAEAAAAIRGLHYLYEDPHILSDPFASHFTNWKWRLILSNRFFPNLLKTTVMRSIYSAVGGQILSRARYTEDKLQDAVTRGVRQYVILGAGMDSFVLRHPELGDRLTVFEIDHPATQAIKRERVTKVTGGVPGNLDFVPVNFENETVADALRRTSYKPDEPAFFSWIGTTFYLTRESIFDTLSSIKGCSAKGSELVLDYSIADGSLSPNGIKESKVTKKFVAKRGETYVSDFDHDEIVSEINAFGFDLIQQVTPEIMHELYFSDRLDGLKTPLWAAMLHLRVN